MAETEQIIYINGYGWIIVPQDVTPIGPTYSARQVNDAGGNPAVVRGPVISNEDE